MAWALHTYTITKKFYMHTYVNGLIQYEEIETMLPGDDAVVEEDTEEELDVPELDEEDLEENDLTEEEAENIEWDEKKK